MSALQPAALHKVTARHLSRQAMLYVRQSTLHQVLENTESTARQYGLREHVGLVMGLEVSRLARSSLDWHHLLEICTMTGTLILE